MKLNYDVRTIYVGTIAKQTEVKEYVNYGDFSTGFLTERDYKWDYEKDNKIGLFVKTINGYMHILTGALFKTPTRRTGNQHVVLKDSLTELAKYDTNIVKHFVQKNNSYRISLEQIDYLENRFNDELNAENEVEENLNV